MNAPRCRECGAPVEFVRTARGKYMPLDPQPVDRTTVVTGEPGNAVIRDGVVHVLAPGASIEPGEAMRVPHFATCLSRPHGARGRQMRTDRGHAQLDADAEAAAERDLTRRERRVVDALRREAARLRETAAALERLADEEAA
jgi:hypothetical protein